MAAEPVFVDTDVLVYVDQAGSGLHTSARAAGVGRLEQDGAGAVDKDRQVLRKNLATVTRPDPAGVAAMTRARGRPAAVEGFLRRLRARGERTRG